MSTFQSECQLQLQLQDRVLDIINENGPCDIMFLAARLGMRVTYLVVRIVHPLIHKGKIRLTPDGYVGVG